MPKTMNYATIDVEDSWDRITSKIAVGKRHDISGGVAALDYIEEAKQL